MDAVALVKKVWWDTNIEIVQQTFALMNNFNRDLLVLFNQELMSPQAIEVEVEKLHTLLQGVERLHNLITAHEIIDLNKYKVTSQYSELRKTLLKRELKPFVFLNNKN